MIKCPGCQKELDDSAKFCTGCGMVIKPQAQQQPSQPQSQQQADQPQNPQKPQHEHTQQTPPPNQAQNTAGYQSPPPYYSQPQYQQAPPYGQYQQPMYGMPQNQPGVNEPLSVWQYVLMMIVPAIPIVGFILMIVWAVGGANTNVNRTNYARAYWLLALIGIVVSILLSILMVTALAPFMTDLYNELMYY